MAYQDIGNGTYTSGGLKGQDISPTRSLRQMRKLPELNLHSTWPGQRGMLLGGHRSRAPPRGILHVGLYQVGHQLVVSCPTAQQQLAMGRDSQASGDDVGSKTGLWSASTLALSFGGLSLWALIQYPSSIDDMMYLQAGSKARHIPNVTNAPPVCPGYLTHELGFSPPLFRPCQSGRPRKGSSITQFQELPNLQNANHVAVVQDRQYGIGLADVLAVVRRALHIPHEIRRPPY